MKNKNRCILLWCVAAMIILFSTIILGTQVNETFVDRIETANRVHIWQGERGDKTLRFMYKPVMDSLNEILKNRPVNLQVDYYNFDEIQSNDVLIWVGDEKIPDFDALRSRGVYTVYYNTEPNYRMTSSDEIWTYSKYLWTHYKKANDSQTIRFVPIACEENAVSVPYKKGGEIDLLFLGVFIPRQDKVDRLMKNKTMQRHLKEVYNIWNDDEYNKMISRKANLYINLTKSNMAQALPSVRINKQLSHKCIIISEHTNDIDEELYKGLVIFCDLDEIPQKYTELASKSANDLQKMSESIYASFYERFCSENVHQIMVDK